MVVCAEISKFFMAFFCPSGVSARSRVIGKLPCTLSRGLARAATCLPRPASATLSTSVISMSAAKKGNGKAAATATYAYRDIVLGKVRGYQPWPGMVRPVFPSTRRRTRLFMNILRILCVGD